MARLAFIYFTPRHQRHGASTAREAAFSAAPLSLPTMLKYFIPDGRPGIVGVRGIPRGTGHGNGTKAGTQARTREREREREREESEGP